VTADGGRVPRSATGAILLLTLGVRIVASARALVVPRDSVVLLDLARAFADGDAARALSHHQHPLYPALTAIASLTGPSLETAGTLVAILAGTLAVLPLLSIARRLVGPRAALAAGILYALSPYPVRFAAVPLTDSTHLLLVLLGISLGLRATMSDRPDRAALAAGVALGLAYLTRPEGLIPAVVLVPALVLLARGRGRPVAPALLVIGLAIVAVPYVVHLSSERDALTVTGKWKAGGEAKAEQWARITGRARSSLPAATLETGRELAVTLHPALALLAAIGLVRRGRPRAGAVVIAAVVLLVLAACVRLHWLRSYLSHRHVLVPSLLLLPLAGRGLVVLSEWIAARTGRRASIVTAGAAVVVAAILAPKTFALQGEDKVALIDRGREIAAASDVPSGPLALRDDARIAHYAGRRVLILPGRFLPLEEGPSSELDAWLAERKCLFYLNPEQAGSFPITDPARLVRLPSGAAVYRAPRR
jgi:hypothetical protein